MGKPIEWEALTPGAREVLRAAGETSPLAFTSLWFNITQGDSFRSNWHHHYFNWAFEQVLEGKARNVIINTPPGSTKTEFFSIHAPVFCQVKFPRVRILNASYSKDLVSENSERSRSLVKSAEFQSFYPFQIGKDKVDDWTLERDGKRVHQVYSRPSGGQITGVRGGYMGPGFSGYIMADDWDKIDDLFSETKRKAKHRILVNTLRSRKAKPDTPFIHVQQRGHVQDSTAFLLAGGMGLKIDLHIVIPALIDMDFIKALPDGIRERCIKDVCSSESVDGQWSYWPEKEDIKDLIALREANPYTFVSQYMQAPEALNGGIFKERDFLYYGEEGDLPLPEIFDYRFTTADTAQKTKEWNDWTVFAEWGVYMQRLYRLAYLRKKMEAKELRQQFESFVNAAWAKNSRLGGNLRAVLVEDKSSGTGLIQEVKGRLPIDVTAVPRDRDKLTRAMDAQPHVAAQKVVLPYGDAANYEFVSEVCSFSPDDSHKHDDQTDVMIDAVEHAFITPLTGSKAGVFVRKKM